MKDLQFVPHEGIFTDFLITCNDDKTIRDKFLSLGAHAIDKGDYTVYLWNENLGQRFIVGLGVIDNELVMGPKRLNRWPATLGAGSYTLVDVTGSRAVVQPDPFGMHVIYAGRGIVTNRLHLAALAVGEVDVDTALVTTYNEGVFSFSFNTFSTPVNGISMLAVGERVHLSKTLRVVQENVASDFEIRSPGEYWELIELGAAEIINNVEAVLDSGYPVMCDITGGRDSRIIFGALVASGRIQDVSFNTNTHNPALQRDLEIGTGLVKLFNGRYSSGPVPIGYAQHSIEQNLQRRRSQLFGSYHFITEGELRPTTTLTHGYAIRMLGGGGELYRDYYQSLFSTVAQDEASTAVLVRQMVQTHRGSVFGNKFLPRYIEHFEETFRKLPGDMIGHKMDGHYLNFRNRFHFGSRQSTASSIYAINPGTSKYLLRAARSLPFEEKTTGRVLFDVIRALDEKLAYLPYDKPVDPQTFESHYHKSSTFDNSRLHVEPAVGLAKDLPAKTNPVRPFTPDKPAYDFQEILGAEINESYEVLSEPGSLFSEVMDKNLDHFIDYAKAKSPRHYAALASRLRAFADYTFIR